MDVSSSRSGHFTPWNKPLYPLNMRLGKPQNRCRRSGGQKNLWPLPEFDCRTPSVRSLVAIPTTLSWLPQFAEMEQNKISSISQRTPTQVPSLFKQNFWGAPRKKHTDKDKKIWKLPIKRSSFEFRAKNTSSSSPCHTASQQTMRQKWKSGAPHCSSFSRSPAAVLVRGFYPNMIGISYKGFPPINGFPLQRSVQFPGILQITQYFLTEICA